MIKAEPMARCSDRSGVFTVMQPHPLLCRSMALCGVFHDIMKYLSLMLLLSGLAHAAPKPNVIVILADDLGRGDREETVHLRPVNVLKGHVGLKIGDAGNQGPQSTQRRRKTHLADVLAKIQIKRHLKEMLTAEIANDPLLDRQLEQAEKEKD